MVSAAEAGSAGAVCGNTVSRPAQQSAAVQALSNLCSFMIQFPLLQIKIFLMHLFFPPEVLCFLRTALFRPILTNYTRDSGRKQCTFSTKAFIFADVLCTIFLYCNIVSLNDMPALYMCTPYKMISEQYHFRWKMQIV